MDENFGNENPLFVNEDDRIVSGIIASQMSDEERMKKIGNLDEEKANYIVEKLGDLKWRLQNLYHIVDENGDKVLFKPNFIQRQIIKALYNGNDWYIRHIILKYRQWWVSTLFTILLLDEFLWGGKNIYNVIIAHERKLLITLFKKIRFAFDCMDEEFKIFIPKMDSDNANELFISETNNRLAVSLDTRWETPTRIHITELAWREVSQQSKLLLAVNPLRKTRITIESTANWVWNPFYQLVQTAREIKGTYKLLFYPWFIDDRNKMSIPEWEEMILDDKEEQLRTLYDLTPMQLYWRRKQIDDARALGEDGEKKFDQENPHSIDAAFISSGKQVFDLSRAYKINKPVAVVWDFKIYGEPEDCMVFWVDTAEWGGKSDNSVIIWMNRRGKILVTYKKQVEDYKLASAMDELLNLKVNGKYFVGTILPERNKWAAFITEARHYDWFHLILKWRDQTAISDDTKEYYWFVTTKWSKELLIRDFRKAVYNKTTEITEEVYQEITTYIYHTDGSAGAMSNKKDDMVMGTMIALHWVLYEPFIVTYNNTNFERKYKNPIEEFDAKLLSWEYEKPEYSEWETV